MEATTTRDAWPAEMMALRAQVARKASVTIKPSLAGVTVQTSLTRQLDGFRIATRAYVGWLGGDPEYVRWFKPDDTEGARAYHDSLVARFMAIEGAERT